MYCNLPVVETANLHVLSTKDFQEDVRDGLDLVLGKHSCVHLKLQSSLREEKRGTERQGSSTGESDVHLHTLGLSTSIADSLPLFLGPERKVSCLCENSFL